MVDESEPGREVVPQEEVEPDEEGSQGWSVHEAPIGLRGHQNVKTRRAGSETAYSLSEHYRLISDLMQYLWTVHHRYPYHKRTGHQASHMFRDHH